MSRTFLKSVFGFWNLLKIARRISNREFTMWVPAKRALLTTWLKQPFMALTGSLTYDTLIYRQTFVTHINTIRRQQCKKLNLPATGTVFSPWKTAWKIM